MYTVHVHVYHCSYSICTCFVDLFTESWHTTCTLYSIQSQHLYSCFLEYKKRFEIYKENLVLARKMQDMEKGSAKYGETVFSDLTGLCTSRYMYSWCSVITCIQ